MKPNLNSRPIFNRILLACFFILSIPLAAQQIRYTDGNDSWNPNLLGNHRAVVEFSGKGDIAKTTIAWRRRDQNPEQKRIIVQDATGATISNIKTVDINRESGTIYFEPVSGQTTYYVYYMPYIDEGDANYLKGVYATPENKADVQWLYKIKPNLHSKKFKV